ncbi:MAG: ABC transporter ATP-binding protein [Spirochaetaceae bacterium]|nr:ABC transporter ATP-binding protein [Spirochaetaceae bacterium]
MNTDTPFLQVINLTKNFGEKKISANFSLKKSETMAILGPSGSGKSTILSMIAGLLVPDAGSVFLDGIDITFLKPYRRNIGMVFQSYALFPHLNVFDNVAFALKAKKEKKEEIEAQVISLLKKFEILDLKKRWVQELSGGEKQRVALARTLAVQPKLILFDEPLSALDADLRSHLAEELKDFQRREKYCAIYVTHDSREAQFLADRLYQI